MTMTGTFMADFSAIGAEAKKAQVFLDALVGTAGNTGVAFDKMTQRFTGAKVIAEATQMAAVFDRAGGAAKFTSAELAEMARTGGEAAEKLRALGLEVPASIQRIAAATRDLDDGAHGAEPRVNSLRTAVGSFDAVLGAAGIHMAPEIHALGELGDAATKGAGELGLIATAGLVVGAGIGGWKIGRAVSDFFDLDRTIGNATAKLLGFGDVAAEVAGAKSDALARASKTIGFEVLSLSTALEINSTSFLKYQNNAATSAGAVAAWQAQIAKVRGSGDLEQLTKDLDSQNFKVADLAKRYDISVEALQFFQREQKAAANAVTAANAQIAEGNAKHLRDLAVEMAANKATRDAEGKTLLELTKLNEQYRVTEATRSGTANEIERARINATFEVLRASLIKTHNYSAEVAAALERDWAQALDGVGIDFGALKTHSIENLNEIAENAQATFEAMGHNGLTYSQAAIQHFRNVRDQAVANLHSTRDEQQAAFIHMRDEVDRSSFEYRNWLGNVATDAQKAALALAGVTQQTNAAAQAAAKAAAEKEARRTAGGSNEYDLSTPEGRAKVPDDIAEFLHDGYSFEQAALLAYARKFGFSAANDPLLRIKGPRVPGYAGGVTDAPGGWSMVGERGPEPMYVPKGASIFPTGANVGGGVVIQNTFHIVDTEANIVRRVSDGITRSILQTRKLV